MWLNLVVRYGVPEMAMCMEFNGGMNGPRLMKWELWMCKNFLMEA